MTAYVLYSWLSGHQKPWYKDSKSERRPVWHCTISLWRRWHANILDCKLEWTFQSTTYTVFIIYWVLLLLRHPLDVTRLNFSMVLRSSVSPATKEDFVTTCIFLRRLELQVYAHNWRCKIFDFHNEVFKISAPSSFQNQNVLVHFHDNYQWHSVETPTIVHPQWNIFYWGCKWIFITFCWSVVGSEWGTTSVYFGITYVCFILQIILPVFAVELQ